MEIDTELFDFSESSNLRTNKAVVDTLNLILDFSTDHQIGPIVTCIYDLLVWIFYSFNC